MIEGLEHNLDYCARRIAELQTPSAR